MFTDRRNLLYLFAPLAKLNSPIRVLTKIHRCAVYLTRFVFSINNMEDMSSIIADMLTPGRKDEEGDSIPKALILASI